MTHGNVRQPEEGQVGAILRAHPHEPLAAHQGSEPPAPTGADHPQRMELMALGIISAISGMLIVLGAWLVGITPAGSNPWGAAVYIPGEIQWNFWVGAACGGILVLLGLALARWPEFHAALGATIVIASAGSLLSGPLLWAGFMLGIVAGAVSILVGSPASTKLYFYTPMHVALAPPRAPGPPPPPPSVGPAAAAIPAGRFCASCGRSVSSEAEFCPWCGSAQAARPG